jgi:hypothetical protein
MKDSYQISLLGLRKGDKGMAMLMRRLRQEVTMNLKWRARRLCLGSWTCSSNLLNEKRRH